MAKSYRVLTRGIFFSFCLCAFFVLPAFGQWSYEQIDAACDITSMWAASETDMYVGGGKANSPGGCLYHYDGIGWEPVNFTGLPIVFDIWGSSGDDVYVVGLGGRYHYNGFSWARISSTVGTSAWGFSANNVFIGYQDIKRYRGTTWGSMVLPTGLPTPVQINGIWGFSESDMYAVGPKSLVLHYNGNQNGQWTLCNNGLEGTDYELYSVWGSSPDDIFASGYNTILHYDGMVWTKFDISLSGGDWIHSLWGFGPDDVYAATFESGYILHYDGISWSIINPAAPVAALQQATGDTPLSTTADMPASVKLKAICGISAESIYFAGDDGIVIHYTPDAAECQDDNNCEEGYECVAGLCEQQIPDNPPAITSGPFLAAGYWPVLPTSAESPMVLKKNYSVLWTFSDDFASCSGACTHSAEYQVLGNDTWTSLTVSSDAAQGYAWVDLPVSQLQNGTYVFRFTVTDCAGQSTQSGTYYFKVARPDRPPVITDGPYLAAGPWPLLPTSQESPMFLKRNYTILWSFSDDYVSCSGLCTHRARYMPVDGSTWIELPVSTDPDGTWYAFTELPVSQLENGTYVFVFDVTDCAGQTTYSNTYYFKVNRPL